MAFSEQKFMKMLDVLEELDPAEANEWDEAAEEYRNVTKVTLDLLILLRRKMAIWRIGDVGLLPLQFPMKWGVQNKSDYNFWSGDTFGGATLEPGPLGSNNE